MFETWYHVELIMNLYKVLANPFRFHRARFPIEWDAKTFYSTPTEELSVCFLTQTQAQLLLNSVGNHRTHQSC